MSDYGNLNKLQLQEELSRRDLPTSGSKDDLLGRLIDSDINPNDSASTVKSTSAGSKTSQISNKSSIKLKILDSKLENLREKQKLKREVLELQLKQEELELKSEREIVKIHADASVIASDPGMGSRTSKKNKKSL